MYALPPATQYEHNILRRAMLQRRALKHAYKVDKVGRATSQVCLDTARLTKLPHVPAWRQIKANKMADELDRETKSLRARRSSLQTALSARLVKATLEAERQASADRKCVVVLQLGCRAACAHARD